VLLRPRATTTIPVMQAVRARARRSRPAATRFRPRGGRAASSACARGRLDECPHGERSQRV
jgi:hypothetical protein